jgi:TatD DNase family protein
MLFDTHVHLNDVSYENYQEIIQNALSNGVKKMVVVGFDLDSSKRAIEIAKEYSFVYAAIGIHPSEANKEYDNDLVELEKLICDKVVAIGEIGLDYHYDGVIKENQSDLFIKQIQIAKRNNLPIIIHSRDACRDTVDILKEYKDCYSKGIMHCYAYSYEIAKVLINYGFIFSFGGVVTYKNAKEVKEVVTNLDINKIILETDAPYLTPTPHRGKRNEPAYIKYVADEIALLKGLDKKDVEEITYNNACDFFGVSREN